MKTEWSIDLTKYAAKQEIKYKNFVTEFVYSLYSNIVKLTPVDTGRCRANWNIGVGSVDETVRRRAKTPRHKSVPRHKGVKSDYYISNHLEYTPTLEFGGYPKGETAKTINGFSKQAPNGMVRVTLARVNELIQNALLKAKGTSK